MLLRVLVGVVLVQFLYSCGPGINEKPIKQVDSLLVIVQDGQKLLKELDANAFNSVLDTVSEDVRFIQSQYIDTMDLKTAVKIDKYSRILKSVSKFKSVYASETKELQYTHKQLTNLKKDLESEVVLEDSFVEFYPAEREAVTRHFESVNNLKSWYESIENSYSLRKPGIDSMIVEMKK